MPLPVIVVELIGSLFSIKLIYGKHCQTIIIIIVLLQQCVSFYFWSPAGAPHEQRSAGFCSLVAIFHDLVHPTFANLLQSRQIPALLSIFFSVFLFLPYQLRSLVPLLGFVFHSFYTRHHTNILIVYFIFQTFPTYHSQHYGKRRKMKHIILFVQIFCPILGSVVCFSFFAEVSENRY